MTTSLPRAIATRLSTATTPQQSYHSKMSQTSRDMTIAILTCTFNRADKLIRCFNSLEQQTDHGFCWYIIDDGSHDNTFEVVNDFKEISSFRIVFHKQATNNGKHSCLNIGYQLIQETWTLILDSDDMLAKDCIAKLKEAASTKDFRSDSISFLRMDYLSRKIIGTMNIENHTNYIQRLNSPVSGDKAGMHLTAKAKKFSFPVFPGETFMSEMPFFLWFGTRFKTKFINYPGYICEYQSDGLSSKITNSRHACPKSTNFVYSCIANTKEISLRSRLKALINLVRFSDDISSLNSSTFRAIALCLLPIARYYRKFEKRRIGLES